MMFDIELETMFCVVATEVGTMLFMVCSTSLETDKPTRMGAIG